MRSSSIGRKRRGDAILLGEIVVGLNNVRIILLAALVYGRVCRINH
jgi:hypothetical protein